MSRNSGNATQKVISANVQRQGTIVVAGGGTDMGGSFVYRASDITLTPDTSENDNVLNSRFNNYAFYVQSSGNVH